MTTLDAPDCACDHPRVLHEHGVDKPGSCAGHGGWCPCTRYGPATPANAPPPDLALVALVDRVAAIVYEAARVAAQSAVDAIAPGQMACVPWDELRDPARATARAVARRIIAEVVSDATARLAAR